MAYADDITITSTHTSTSAAKKYIQPYLQKVFVWTKQNNLILNPDKTNNFHSAHARPCKIYEQSGPKNTQQYTTHGNAPKTHIHHTHPLMATYKAVMRPALEYASSIWPPLASSTSINKLKVMQYAALRSARRATYD